MKESLASKKRRAGRIIAKLHQEYAQASCALIHRNAWELLIATILSAQSTDETVNRVTPVLFKKFSSPAELAQAPLEEVEKIIYPTGFYRQKARNIQRTSQQLVEQYQGMVPDRMEALIELPGVARKTANVVLGTWFKKNVGVVVDTHVGRIAERLTLTWSGRDSKDALKIEQDLMQIIPQDDWTFFSHAVIWHGRKICKARKPDCLNCCLQDDCLSQGQYD